jgi:hypothetical protein
LFVCVCLSRECTQPSCRNVSLDETRVWIANFLNVLLTRAGCDVIVMNSSLHCSNSGTSNEYLASAHLSCKVGR